MDISIKRRTRFKILPFITFIFFCLIAFLLYQSLSEINFAEVKAALNKVSFKGLLPTLGLVIFNFIILASFDFLGFRYLKLPGISALKIYCSAMICYTFTLNLGAFVGGLGLRYRIYSGWNVSIGDITKVIIFSTLSNWLGHIFLLSFVILQGQEDVVKLTGFPREVTFIVSTLGMVIVILYFFLCSKRKQITYKKVKFMFPPIKLAFAQLLLSVIQWSLLTLIIISLMEQLGAAPNFMQVLFTYLLSGLAGVVTHIPAGLGVHEAVFLKMNFEISSFNILAVLILFRVTYYLIPLLLALPGYLGIEYYQKKNKT